MYNKRKFNKINDKKVLHKVKKQWVTISLALFMMIGGGAVTAHINASADATNNQNQPQVSVKFGSENNSKNTITNKAKALHQNLLSKASVNNKPTINNRVHKQINTTHQGNLVTVNNKPAKKVNNINKVGMHKANLYHGYVYNRINKPFRSLRINHTVALHSSISLNSGHIFGYLHSGKTVKANRMFKQFGHYGNYLRYEINLANKHTAFITGNNHFVSYVIPARNYKYYQNKANKLVKNANYKNAKKVGKKLYKLNKQRNHNFHKYANLYEMAFNAQQNHKYSVVVDYNAKRHTTNITPASTVTSVVSAAPRASSVSASINAFIPAMPSYVAPVSFTSSSSATMPSNSSVASKSSSASAKSMSSSASSSSASSMKSSSVNSMSSKPSSVSSSASKSVSSASTNSSAASKVPSSSNQPALKSGSYNGLNYIYNPANNSINFVSGKLNVTSRGSFLNNDTTPSDIRNANTITFGNIDLNNLPNMNNMLANDQNIKNLDLGNNFNTKSVTDMGNMFRADTTLQKLALGNNFDTSNVNNMDNMFADDGDLTLLVLPTQFNTTNINNTYNSDQSDNMQSMFHGDSDLSSLTIQSPNTKFNNDSDLNSVSDKASWNQQGTNNTVNLGDGNSHVGTWIYKPYMNNNPANDILPKNINMKVVNSDVQSKVNSEVAAILNSDQHPAQQTNLQGMLGAAKPVRLGAINNTTNVLTSSSIYTKLAKDVANGANDSWNESDLTLSPENITGPADERGTNVFNKVYGDSDTANKGLVRSTEENLGFIKINGIGTFVGNLSTSDFTPTKIVYSDWVGNEPSDDPDYNGIHTIVKYSGPISISNNSTNSDIANKLVSQFGLGNVSKDQLKLAKNMGLGYKYHNGNLYGILALGPAAKSNITICTLLGEAKPFLPDSSDLADTSYNSTIAKILSFISGENSDETHINDSNLLKLKRFTNSEPMQELYKILGVDKPESDINWNVHKAISRDFIAQVAGDVASAGTDIGDYAKIIPKIMQIARKWNIAYPVLKDWVKNLGKEIIYDKAKDYSLDQYVQLYSSKDPIKQWKSHENEFLSDIESLFMYITKYISSPYGTVYETPYSGTGYQTAIQCHNNHYLIVSRKWLSNVIYNEFENKLADIPQDIPIAGQIAQIASTALSLAQMVIPVINGTVHLGQLFIEEVKAHSFHEKLPVHNVITDPNLADYLGMLFPDPYYVIPY